MNTINDYQKATKLNEQFKSIEAITKRATPEQLEIVKKIRQRAKREDAIPVKEFTNRLIIKRLDAIAYALPNVGYSMGGVVSVWCWGLEGKSDTRRYYSKSCRYRENHFAETITISFDELKNIKIIGGLVTYIYPNQSRKLKKCWWYEGKGKNNRFELIKKEGYIYNDYHSESKEKAIKFGKQREEYRKIIAKAEVTKAKAMAKALRQQYDYNDSITSGNCEAGTRAFCLRLHLDPNKKYRGAYILKLAEQKSTNSILFVKRMIEYRARQLSK